MMKFKKGVNFILKKGKQRLIGHIYLTRKKGVYYVCLYNNIVDEISYQSDKPGIKDKFEIGSIMSRGLKRIKKKDAFLEIL